MKKLLLKIGCLVGAVLVLFLGWQFYDNTCVKKDPGHYFYYSVVGGNGNLMPDYETNRELKSPISVLGNGITFIATPDEGYQVKQWTFNGKAVKGNTSNTYKAVVEDYNVREQYVTVEFEFEKEVGNKFFSISEAFERGWLTEENMQKLADRYNNKNEEKTQLLINPNRLEGTLAEEIKSSYRKWYLKDESLSLEYVKLWAHYGSYGDCIVVGITDTYFLYDLLIEPEYTVGGATFYKYSSSEIRVWYKGE